MIIIALDLSFANTGVTVCDDGKFHFYEFEGKRNKIGKKGQLLKAKENDIKTFYDNLIDIREKHKPDKVIYLDNYSKGARTTKALAKLMGVTELVFNGYDIETFTDIEVRSGLGINKMINAHLKGLNLDKEEKYLKRKELICDYVENDLKHRVSDDIADSYVLMKYYLKNN